VAINAQAIADSGFGWIHPSTYKCESNNPPYSTGLSQNVTHDFLKWLLLPMTTTRPIYNLQQQVTRINRILEIKPMLENIIVFVMRASSVLRFEVKRYQLQILRINSREVCL